jgi:sugar phosphate isomerase/epimerase
MPKLLLNTIALDPNRWTVDKKPFFPLSSLLQRAGDAGFRFFELWQYHLTHESREEIEKIRTEASDRGISFPVAGFYPRLSVTGRARDRELESVDAVLDRAARLDVQVVKMFVGDRGVGGLRDREYEEAVITMSALVQRAASHGMTVAGEIHENTLFETIPSAIRFMEDVGAENFRVCFQPLDFTDTLGTIDGFNAVRERVVHIHFQGRKGDAMSLLREADIDYALFMRTLARTGYGGTMAIEFVQDCVVNNPADFNLDLVLANAVQDRGYLADLARGEELGLEY